MSRWLRCSKRLPAPHSTGTGAASATPHASAVVLASRGYPESSSSGDIVRGLDDAAHVEGVTVYHAGTAVRGDEIVTAGGRVLTVAADGATYTDAIARAYAAVERITFEGMQYRRDIGRKALI